MTSKQPWFYRDHKRRAMAYRVKCRTKAGIAADLLAQATEERAKGLYMLARSCVLEARYIRTGETYSTLDCFRP
jgi:hypothetical protein